MNMIVAVEKNWGIGRDNDLLFRIPPDMKHFRDMTLGKVVVMGEGTLISLPGSKGLPDRENIVLSDDPDFSCSSATVYRSMDDLLEALQAYDAEDIFIIGGASVYNQLMDCCTHAYVTKVEISLPHDLAIRSLDGREGWELAEQSKPQQYEGIGFTFNTYVNNQVADKPAPPNGNNERVRV